MNSEERWSDLVPRLQADLRARTSKASTLAQDGDAWVAAERMLRTHGQVLLSTHPSLSVEDVEDIVQDIFLKLQSQHVMRRLSLAGSAAGYITVMMRNAAIDLIRSRRRIVEYPDSFEDQAAIERADPNSGSEKIERASSLWPALQHLTPGERELLELRFWREMSIAEIADHLGITYSASAVRVFRVLRRLREHLVPM
jgi:RNA polymerase sigma-70 factor, ECF subfamily